MQIYHLALCWLFGSTADWQSSCPFRSSTFPCHFREVAGFNLPSETCHSHQPGLLQYNSHQSLQGALQEKSGPTLSWMIPDSRAWPLFLFGSREVRNFPLCLCTLGSLGIGPGGRLPNPRIDLRPTTGTIQRQTHLNFLLRKCFLSPKL